LELGTNLGVGTQALALHTASQVTSVEGCPQLFEFSKKQFASFNNIRLVHSSFKEALDDLSRQSWDLIFIDGHHEKKATLSYFEQLLPATHNDTLIILDDINWSRGMLEAWAEIKAHPKVRVSIDTFFWGLVFFREEQAKEHFAIKL
jgi:predicted O-methyltransferase YrrM